MPGIIGRKLGSSHVFKDDGEVVHVTYVVCQPNTVHHVKPEDKDGFLTLVLGAEPKEKKATKTKKFALLREFKWEAGEKKRGESIKVDLFAIGEKVTVVGQSKGKGFQGRVRRHNASVLKKTHGTKYARHGAIGAICITARLQKGVKMPGRMGGNKTTLHNREVVFVDVDRNIIALKGPVPGAINSFILLKK